MKFAEVIPLTGALLNFSLALFVLLQNPRAMIARVFFLLGLSLAIWNFGTFQMFRVGDYEHALFWARFLQFGVIFIPLTLFHISALVAQVHVPRKLVIGLYTLHVCLVLSNFTDLFLRGVRNVGYAWYAVAGPGFWVLFAIFSLMWVSVGILIWHRRKLPRIAQRSISPMIAAQTAIALFGCNDALPILGVDYYFGTKYQVYPFGSMAAILYGMIVGYSVLQYQLLDVRVALGRATAKAVRVLFVFFTGLCTLLVFWLVAEDQFSVFSFFAGLASLMAGAVCAAILFPRLFGESSEALERRVLGDTFEYQDQVRNFIEGMTWYTDTQSLLNDLHDLLIKAFKLKSYQIILRDETSRVFTLFRAFPEQAQRQFPELKTESPVFRFFDWGKSAYLALNSEYLRPASSSLERQAVNQLADLGGQFCFPLASQSEPFGLFIVGGKTNGEPFTATNITLLVALMKNLSLMVNQIRLKDQIMQAQELDLLGRMSRGMAHDLNNLLTPVWTLFQLSAEVSEGTGKPPEFDDELLPSALRNIKVMRAYIKEALFFSENLRPDIQLGRLDMIVKQAAELGRASRKKPVHITTETPDNVLVELDEVLIQRLIANLISNAIDASPEQSTIRVELIHLAKTEASRDWLRVRIVDQGEGIKKEDLNRIFTPYFTTKNHGDENRGFGLGLAICRKIVNLHGGNVSISSQLKQGTTVELDLPSRQQQPKPPTLPQPA